MADRLLSAVLPTSSKRRKRVSRIIDGALRLVRGACAACCGEGSGVAQTLYAKACPCYTFPDEVFHPIDDIGDCALPEGECIFIDLRATLDDEPGVTVAERLWDGDGPVNPDLGSTGPTVIVGGVCYRFVRVDELYADAALTYLELEAAADALGVGEFPRNGWVVDLDPAWTLAGGNGVELEVAVGTEEYSPCSTEAGCSAWTNSGTDFYEAFACDGSLLGQRLFVCARAAYEGNVLDGCLCIDKTIAYTAGAVAALEVIAGVTLHTLTPNWLPVWRYGSGHPNREPAQSCCFCSPDCLTGQDWSDVWGVDKWFYKDVCCGNEATLRFDVELSYTRVLVQTLGPGDILTTTITAVVDSIVDRVGGGSTVNMTITTRGERTGIGETFFGESPAVLDLEPQCCLPYGGQAPSLGTLTQDGSDFIDDWDGTVTDWYQVTVSNDGPSETPPIGDVYFRVREAWNNSPWAGVGLQLNFAGGGSGEVFEPGLTNGVGGSCRRSTFTHSSSFVDDDGRSDTIDINLTIKVVPDESSPCNYIGACGSAGWEAVDLGEMMP